MSQTETPLSPGMPVVLFENNWLYDGHVTGQGAGFVTVTVGKGTKLVRRHSIYVLPEERGRLQSDIQMAINQLGTIQDKLARKEDPVPFCQESA